MTNKLRCAYSINENLIHADPIRVDAIRVDPKGSPHLGWRLNIDSASVFNSLDPRRGGIIFAVSAECHC